MTKASREIITGAKQVLAMLKNLEKKKGRCCSKEEKIKAPLRA